MILLSGLEKDEAQALLEKEKGRLRKALAGKE